MEQMDKNTVKSENQLNKMSHITFENETGKGARVLFVGNSITRHGVKADIGWFNDWGMAATSKENDYVHITKKLVLEKGLSIDNYEKIYEYIKPNYTL